MKTQFLLLALLTSVLGLSVQAQNRTIINSTNSEISDNLDLRAVASIFGDSRNLQDFERRLNDPRLQISNLDLNYDNEVDYLRVIESVQKRTHVVIIQSVIDRDLYQDIATIEVEKDWYDNVSIQVVGNNYMYGNNYIFEPVYYSTPRIYASFWISNYRPYCSSWTWNFYPSYFYTWNPFPVFRYRSNINNCLNTYNDYNYVSYRRSNLAINIYNSRRSNAYEKQHPNNSFARRNNDVGNRFELDQRRNGRTMVSRNDNQRNEHSRATTTQRTESSREYSQNRNDNSRATTPQRTESSREYSQNRNDNSRATTPQRTESSREYSQNRNDNSRATTPQRAEPSREYSQNRNDSQRATTPQRAEPSREYSQNRNDSQRATTPQRTESSRSNQDEARNSSSREGNRRT